MSAIETSADGSKIFLAVEDGDGFPLVLMADRNDLADWDVVYEPGEGDAVNVKATSDPDRMIFYGYFGIKQVEVVVPAVGIDYRPMPTVILRHTISTGANLDIGPADELLFIKKTFNAVAINPSNPDEVWAINIENEDLRRSFGVFATQTLGAGTTTETWATWETLDASLGVIATALAVLFGGDYFLDRAFVAGDSGATLDLIYSPNEFADKIDLAGAILELADDISGVEVAGI